jgi:hypothetical protein
MTMVISTARGMMMAMTTMTTMTRTLIFSVMTVAWVFHSKRARKSRQRRHERKVRDLKHHQPKRINVELGLNFGDTPLPPRNISSRSSSSRSKSRTRHPPKPFDLLDKETSRRVAPTSPRSSTRKPYDVTKRVRPAMSLLDEIRKRDE